MREPAAKLHRVLLDEVEILFEWCGDRWSHAIFFRGVDAAAWRSVEGPDEAAGDAAWPASPVLVELSPVPSATAVVGVGRAGRSHYSVSFTAKGPRLLVECACRIHEPPGWIGSTYERAGSPGRPASLVRIPAAIDRDLAAPLPRTVTWSYIFEPTGPVKPAAADA